MIETTKKVVRVHAMAAIVIVISCSSQSPEGEARVIGDDPNSHRFGSVAHAAVQDASQELTPTPAPSAIMPENPSHISLRLPKAPKVVVRTMSGKVYPYPVTVIDDGDEQVVTLYLPQGVQMNVSISSIDEQGKPLAEPVQLSLEPEAKLGTTQVELGSTASVVHFSGGAQNKLQLGENVVSGPVTDEFIGGQMRSIMEGVYSPDVDQVCEVTWSGCKEVYSFVDGPPVRRTESFAVSLKAGQKLGLYPVVGEAETVRFTLREPTCPPPSEE